MEKFLLSTVPHLASANLFAGICISIYAISYLRLGERGAEESCNDTLEKNLFVSLPV